MAKVILPETCVYIITCTVNGKIYIGSSSRAKQRWREHRRELRRNKHHNQHLQRAWNKHGDHSFTFEVLEICAVEKLIAREQYWLDTLEPYKRHIGFNIRQTADHRDCPLETRSKLRAANLGKTHTPEARAKLSALWKGKKHTPETRAKMRASAKGKNLGRKHTPEQIAKISATQRGRKHSPEHIAKQADANAKEYIVTSPDGVVMRIRNLSKFSREHGLSSQLMGHVASGKQYHHKGWQCRRITNA